MRFQSFLLVLTSASVSIAATIASRQDGPVDPGIAPNCNFYDTAGPGRDTCAHFETYWSISHEKFIQWVCIKILRFRHIRALLLG